MEYEVYFEGKMFVEADDESLATGKAYENLKRSGSNFRITSVRES